MTATAESLPAEHAIYAGPSTRALVLSGILKTMIIMAVMIILTPNPQDNIIFFILITVGMGCLQVGFTIMDRARNTITFHPGKNKLSIGRREFSYSELKLEAVPLLDGIAIVGETASALLTPRWVGGGGARIWKDQDLRVLEQFLDRAGNPEARETFKRAWLKQTDQIT